MIALAAALWLSQPVASPPQAPATWRIVATPTLHVGVRPHVLATPDEVGIAVSVQLSVLIVP